MNPIFVFLVVLGAALLWLVCSFIYRPIGRFFYRLWHDAKEVIDFEEETQNENKNETKGEN